MTAVQILKNGTVVDRRALARLSAEDMNAQLGIAYGHEPVRIINDVYKFSSNTAVMDALATDSDDLPLILELRGIALEDDEKFIVSKNVALIAKITAALNIVDEVVVQSNYPFAKLPAKWVLDEKITIGKQLVRRKNSSYQIGIKSLEKIWLSASLYWIKQKNANNSIYITAHGRSRFAAFSSQIVKIGCQKIARYELEQVAVKMGWAFPTA